MWATPFQICLANLRQDIPPTWSCFMSQEEAYEKLKQIAGQDFGYDDKRWERWGRENRHLLRPPLPQ